MSPSRLSADQVVRLLGLGPHPEGGYFRETFRDSASDIAGRAASTAIYFLLVGGRRSRWHRVDAAEAWHWYLGAPLALSIANETGQPGQPGQTGQPVRYELRLGSDLLAGERPQAVVPAGAWQCAESLGAWTLVGCTVAPGFHFAGFELAAADFKPLCDRPSGHR